jgi:hypothetical protein
MIWLLGAAIVALFAAIAFLGGCKIGAANESAVWSDIFGVVDARSQRFASRCAQWEAWYREAPPAIDDYGEDRPRRLISEEDP